MADAFSKKHSIPKISDFLLNHSALSYNQSQRIKNLCLIATELAFFNVLKSKDIIPSIVTGHSIGEFTSLAASGIMPFGEVLEFVNYRDSLIPEKNSLGYMISVNASANDIGKMLHGMEFFISCINSPKNMVISCSRENLAKMEEKLTGKINFRVMDVSQPFHSPLMKGIKEKLETHLAGKKLSLKSPSIPMYSFVLQELIDSASFSEDKIRKILVDSITSPVDFIRQTKNLVQMGNYNFVEIGPSDTLTFFVKSINADSAVTSSPISSVLNLRGNSQVAGDFSELQKSRAFELVSNIVSKLTGYKIEKISLEDRFQEDLGIDSIKQANIAFTIIDELEIPDEQKLEFYDFETIKDVVAFLHNSKALERIDKDKLDAIIEKVSKKDENV